MSIITKSVCIALCVFSKTIFAHTDCGDNHEINVMEPIYGQSSPYDIRIPKNYGIILGVEGCDLEVLKFGDIVKFHWGVINQILNYDNDLDKKQTLKFSRNKRAKPLSIQKDVIPTIKGQESNYKWESNKYIESSGHLHKILIWHFENSEPNKNDHLLFGLMDQDGTCNQFGINLFHNGIIHAVVDPD